MELEIIARVHTPFATKFGVPRQSGLAPALRAELVFEPGYRDPAALRGLEDFSHLWLIWQFSENLGRGWSPTVRPPRLGGNARMGVFATRSPFRPNPLGLSCVALEEILWADPRGPVLRLRGADLVDGTPVYDIKPYLPYADCIPAAAGGFAALAPERALEVQWPGEAAAPLTEAQRAALRQALSCDPRPSYQEDPDRIYGFSFAGREVRFRVSGGELTVLSVE